MLMTILEEMQKKVKKTAQAGPAPMCPAVCTAKTQ
jgi:hypothetical protein